MMSALTIAPARVLQYERQLVIAAEKKKQEQAANAEPKQH